MIWANILYYALKVTAFFTGAISYVTNFFKERRIRNEGKMEAKMERQKGDIEVVTEGNKVREKARESTMSVPESDSLPNDGYRRD